MTTRWLTAVVAVSFAAGGLTGWVAKPTPPAPQPADPMPLVRMPPLRVGDRVRITSTNEVGTVVALDCGDSSDARMVEVGGVGRRVPDADLILIP